MQIGEIALIRGLEKICIWVVYDHRLNSMKYTFTLKIDEIQRDLVIRGLIQK